MSGFPDEVVAEGNGRGERDRWITRLFPDMKFGCVGTIVGFTTAILNSNGSSRPKLQIWRENETQSDLYHKIIPNNIEFCKFIREITEAG